MGGDNKPSLHLRKTDRFDLLSPLIANQEDTMGLLLSGGASGMRQGLPEGIQSSMASLPSDITLNARVLHDAEYLIGNLPHNKSGEVTFGIRIYWVDRFGIMYAEWHVLGLSTSEAEVLEPKVSAFAGKRQVRLVSNISQAGHEATFLFDGLLPIVDKAITETLPLLKKHHWWEERVRNAVR